MKRYVLRAKVRISDVSHEWDLWGAWGGAAEELKHGWYGPASGSMEQRWPGGHPPTDLDLEGVVGQWDRRAVGMGRRALVASGKMGE